MAKIKFYLSFYHYLSHRRGISRIAEKFAASDVKINAAFIAVAGQPQPIFAHASYFFISAAAFHRGFLIAKYRRAAVLREFFHQLVALYGAL